MILGITCANIYIHTRIDSQEDAQYLFTVVSKTDDIKFSHDFVSRMKSLWSDEGVQACFSRAREYQLNDSAE